MAPSSTAPLPRNPATLESPGKLSGEMPGVPGSSCAAQRGMSLVPLSGISWHRDVPEFAVRLLGVVIISLVMPFGWVGAPEKFVAWSAAAKAHQGSFYPPDPWFNDEVSYDSKWLMDDGVVLEPLVGNRVF